MNDKIHKLTEKFISDLRAVMAHEMLSTLEKLVVGVADVKKTKTNQQQRDYQRAYRIRQKLKEGKEVSATDKKWLKNHAAP